MNVLVVGGAGYIGSHACKALSQAGYQPVTLDTLGRGHRELVKWGPLEQGDCGSRSRLDELFLKYEFEAVMHFAAFAEVGESGRDPSIYYHNNIEATRTLLDAMRAHGINRFIFSSTCATYGTPDKMPMTEQTPQAPINPYGRSKLVVEWMLRDFAAAYGLNWTALRYFNACGGDPDGETGECHQPESHLIPRALMAVTGEVPELGLFGTDYPTPDGTCIRDYIHVTDLAAAHVAAMARLSAGGASDAFNLGTGTGVSVRQVVDAIEQVTARKVPLRVEPRRPGDPPVLVADPALAREALGFAPTHSDIATIVATAWRWHRTWRDHLEA